jgi:hypothetical protein
MLALKIHFLIRVLEGIIEIFEIVFNIKLREIRLINFQLKNILLTFANQ